MKRLKIGGWGPGTEDHEKVYILYEENNGLYLANVPLKRAKEIVFAVNFCVYALQAITHKVL